MEEVLPSSMDDDFNRLELEKLLSGLPSSPREEVLANQSSILCNDQAVQNILMVNDVDTIQQTTQFPTPFPDRTMTAIRGLDGTSSSWINQNGPNWLQTPSSDQQWTNQLPMSNQVPGMLPQPPMSQCSQQFPYQFNQVPITPNPYDPQSSTMLPEPSQTLRHQNSFIHQPQPGHVYMTQNATTSQHGGFNQPNPWIQCIPNQGQVDQASVIPNIDNMQQENVVLRNFGKSTRSQMDNLQVRGLQNRAARPNASNSGPDSSLQSQNRGLNTQQQNKGNSIEVVSPPSGYSEQNIENENMGGDIGRVRREVRVVEAGVGDDVVSMTGMRAQENIGGGIGRVHVDVQVVEAERISSHAVAGNDVREFSRIYKRKITWKT
ncbi:hypothetical protein OIU76_024015 [Salix suchowensis]|nr:hypothetical protein OIU76_024015 [Salix suchowensis]